jgi:opacity protein-like surface antigen
MKFQICLIAALAATHLPAQAAGIQFHDWTSAFTGSSYTYSNSSAAGTISGSSSIPGFAGFGGTFGMPTAITTQPPFTSEFQIHGTDGLGAAVTFDFSSGYAWGSGGELIIGNIHNHYEYMLSAWDFGNNPIDVNTWTLVAEYDSSVPGVLGYFSTSTTSRTASGDSSLFAVSDLLADANGGQGGVLHLTGLQNVGRIELILSDSALEPNAQQVDFIIFNVGTPTPEPASLFLTGAAGALLLLARRRSYR